MEPFVDDSERARPVVSQVSDRLFVGSQWAAIALSEGVAIANITGVFNVAFDLVREWIGLQSNLLNLHFQKDVEYRNSSQYVGEATTSNLHHKLQLGKVGLVDGAGNFVGTLAAAVLALRQMLDYKEALLEKDKKTFPIANRRVVVHW